MALLLLRAFALIFVIAFVSLYVQYRGLLGAHGLEPVGERAGAAASTMGAFARVATALGGRHVDHAVELLLLTGALVGAAMALLDAAVCSAGFAVLYWLYWCVVRMGGVFLSYQWDVLLVEAGLICALAAPRLLPGCVAPGGSARTRGPGLVLLRLLAFRLMLQSGAAKLQSDCVTWRGLSALRYHLASQPLPTPGAAVVHLLASDAALRLGVAATLWLQLVASWALLSPMSALARAGALAHVALQLGIAATGNYNFFNATAVLLCCAAWPRLAAPHGGLGGVSLACSVAAAAAGFAAWPVLFDGGAAPVRVRLTRAQLDAALGLAAVPAATALACALYGWASLCALVAARRSARALALEAVRCVVGAALLGAALGALAQGLGMRGAAPVLAQQAHAALGGAGAAHSYGLFRAMTGVGVDGGVARREVELQASRDGGRSWAPVAFKYKPRTGGAVGCWVAPHQPRLDWQLWFVALAGPRHYALFDRLLARLLAGEADVLGLLGPGARGRPTAVRAMLYHTAIGDDGAWNRTLVGMFRAPLGTGEAAGLAVVGRRPASAVFDALAGALASGGISLWRLLWRA